jgi:hypothetical protein
MKIETENRDLVSLLEDLECEVGIAAQLLEAARILAQAQESGKAATEPRRDPHCDPIAAVINEAELKLANAADAMRVFQNLDWRARFRQAGGDHG